MLVDSLLINLFEERMRAVGERQGLFGDPAYPQSNFIEAPFMKDQTAQQPSEKVLAKLWLV